MKKRMRRTASAAARAGWCACVFAAACTSSDSAPPQTDPTPVWTAATAWRLSKEPELEIGASAPGERAEGIPLAEVMAELERRTARSGLEEKASRGGRTG